jgi:hypothetical protein
MIWMPHAGHFIGSAYCRFHLNTYVNGYIISTVGEYVPDSQVRRILRESRGRLTDLRGDAEEAEFGFEELGYHRLYETMVFRAVKRIAKETCCPYRMQSGSELDMRGYNKAEDAYRGHLSLLRKWAKKKKP